MKINLFVMPVNSSNPIGFMVKLFLEYPETQVKADDYYKYLSSYISGVLLDNSKEKINIITYSPFIIDCIEIIAAELNIEVNKYLHRNKVDDYETLYREFTGHIQAMENKREELKEESYESESDFC